jgi:hypothetical protein
MLKSLIILTLLSTATQTRDLPLTIPVVVPLPPSNECELCKVFVEHVMHETPEYICKFVTVCT